jgi:hypothetical protein
MNLSTLIKELWERFATLFQGEKPKEPEALPFARVPEAGSWRLGVGLWSGLLSPFTGRIYYLEISRTSLADKRELQLKPPPSHTFKLFFFRKSSEKRVRTTVFLIYLNCFLGGNSEDYIAIEILGKAIASHLQTLSSRSHAGGSDLAESQIIKVRGQLPQIKLTQANQGLPTVVLLGQSTPQTRAYWQSFIDEQMQAVRADQASQAKRRGFGT